jgi:hypothetical protein
MMNSFTICTLHQIFLQDEMSGKCSTHGEMQRGYIIFIAENVRKRSRSIPNRSCDNSSKMGHRKVVCEDMY